MDDNSGHFLIFQFLMILFLIATGYHNKAMLEMLIHLAKEEGTSFIFVNKCLHFEVIMLEMHLVMITGKHAYAHHVQMGLTFLSNLPTKIDENYDRVKVMIGLVYLT